jgi:hypothetical protein
VNLRLRGVSMGSRFRGNDGSGNDGSGNDGYLVLPLPQQF